MEPALIALALLTVAAVALAVHLSRARSGPERSGRRALGEATGDPSEAFAAGGHQSVVDDAPDHETTARAPADMEPAAGRTPAHRDTPSEETLLRPHGPFTAENLAQLGRYTFDQFVVGAGNRSAYRVAKAAAESPGLRFNPLFIYGGPGLGKTHLMCALANEVHKRDSNAKVLYLTSQAFAERILDAYGSHEVEELERQYTRTDVLLIDDIQFLAMSRSLQAVAARILGQMYELGKQIVVSSDRRPEQSEALAQEISSKFATGVIVEVDRPDAALRTRILRRKARLQGWPLDDELLRHVAHSLNGDIRTLEGVATKLVALKTLRGIQLDKSVVDGLLKEVFQDSAQMAPPPQGGWALPQVAEAGEAAGDPVSGERSRAGMTEQVRGTVTARPAPEAEVVKTENVGPRHVNPMVREFSRPVRVARSLAAPNVVASAVPPAAASVIVVGTSSHLVLNTVEAIVGRGSHHLQAPEGGPWAYVVHLQCDDPLWVLVGTNRWDRESELAQAVTSRQPPPFVVVLDGENPEIANAKELVSSIPIDGGMAVVVLGSFLSDSTDALRKMLRCLLGVPQKFPVLVRGAVDTPGSRTWVKLALESSARVACCDGSEQPTVSSGSRWEPLSTMNTERP